MASASSERATLISPVIQPNNLNNQDHSSYTYDTFSKPSGVDGSVNQEEHDIKVLSSSGHHHMAYTRRWYILLVFSSSSFLQAAAWNTWGPIADTGNQMFLS